MAVTASVQAELVRAYELAGADLNRQVARAYEQLLADPQRVSAAHREIRARELGARVDEILRRLDGRRTSVITTPVLETATEAVAEAERQIRELGVNPEDLVPGSGVPGVSLPGVGFGGVDQAAVEQLAANTAARALDEVGRSLTAAERQLRAQALETFRALGASQLTAQSQGDAEREVNRAIIRGLVTGNTRVAEGAIRQVLGEAEGVGADVLSSYRKLGNQQIQVGRWTGPLRAYASTVVRTRTREATEAARHQRLGQSGINLVQITGRLSENFCTAYVGLVCSLGAPVTRDGVTYPALRSLPSGGPPFHPNCSKSTAAYIPELVSDGRRRRAAIALESYAEGLPRNNQELRHA